MEYLVPKAPADSVVYFIDWSQQLGDSDTITTVTLTVSSGTVTIVGTPYNFGEFIRFIVAGGANGEVATLACTINTVLGQVLTRTLLLAVLTTAVSLTPATSTKRDIINMAFQAMGLADYEFNTTSEEYVAALMSLDSLMAMWRTSNLDLNYNAPTVIGQSDLSDASGIADDAVNGTALALAMRLAPALGKAMSPEVRVAYAQAMNALRARYGVTIERALPFSTPRGAGHKPYGAWWPYGPVGSAG